MDIKCPFCGIEYEGDAGLYGQKVKCESCGKVFTVGGALGGVPKIHREKSSSAPSVSIPSNLSVDAKGLGWLKTMIFILVLANIFAAVHIYLLYHEINGLKSSLHHDLEEIFYRMGRMKLY